MNTRFHGVTSLTFVGIAIALAAIAIFQASLWLGIGYLILCGIASFAVVYSYCAKCPCKAHCAHVLPGKAAMSFKRSSGSYSTVEILSMVMALILLIGPPQLVLWRYPALMIAFWVLCGIAFVQIRNAVCKTCNNVYCPLKNHRQLV